jgi:type II secretory pathway component PulF
MNLPTFRQFLQALPFWFVQTVWILLLVAAVAAAAYALWYVADRDERGRKAVRGFKPDQNCRR